MKNNIRTYINTFLISILSSLVFFFTFKDLIDVDKYCIFTVIIWGIICFNFNPSMNNYTFTILSIINTGISISFLTIQVFYSKVNGINEHIHFLNTCIIGFNVFLLGRSIVLKDSNEKKVVSEELMNKRKADLDRIKTYLNVMNIISINGEWGQGKSFLVDKLKEEVKEEYEIVEIDILSCNLDELPLIIIREIEKILYRNRILSLYSRQLRRFLKDESIFKKFFGLGLIKNPTYLEIINGFKEDLSKMQKKILIIYEDLDRISDQKVIKNIFAFSEKLSDKKVKIIYEYDENNLREIGFDNKYIEKYMPYKVTLTKMNFFEILEFKLKNMKFDNEILNIDDFEFLKEYRLAYERFMYVENIFEDQFYEYMLINDGLIDVKLEERLTIRKMEHFLLELYNCLKYNYKHILKETTIAFFFC